METLMLPFSPRYIVLTICGVVTALLLGVGILDHNPKAWEVVLIPTLIFGGLTLASVPVRLQGGPASALGYWVVAGVLGIAVVGIYHVRRDRSLALTARPGRGKAYAIVGLTTLVLLVAGAALALANGIGPLIAVSLGLLFLASLERRREYAALAMLLAVVAVAPVTLLPQPEAFVVSTLAFGAVLTVAGALLFRSRG